MKLRQSVANLRRILAVELVAAARGLELRSVLAARAPAPATAAVVAALREGVDGPGPDRWLSPELAAAEDLVRSGAIARAAAEAVGGKLR